MSLVVAGLDLGNPIYVSIALADVARRGEEYPQLYGVLQADAPARPDALYLTALRAQAQQALDAHRDELESETVQFLARVADWR